MLEKKCTVLKKTAPTDPNQTALDKFSDTNNSTRV